MRFDCGMDCAWGYAVAVVVDIAGVVDALRNFGFESIDSLDLFSCRDDDAAVSAAAAVARLSGGMHRQGTD